MAAVEEGSTAVAVDGGERSFTGSRHVLTITKWRKPLCDERS